MENAPKLRRKSPDQSVSSPLTDRRGAVNELDICLLTEAAALPALARAANVESIRTDNLLVVLKCGETTSGTSSRG